MPSDKGKLLKKYSKMITKQDEVGEDKFQEVEKELSEESQETSEGLEIEDEENSGEEAYPEIAEELKDPDEPKDEEED